MCYHRSLNRAGGEEVPSRCPLTPHTRGPAWTTAREKESRMRAAMEVAHALPAHFHSLPLASCRGRARRKGARLVRRSTYGERDYAFGHLILTPPCPIPLPQTPPPPPPSTSH